uniref:Coatomer subunit epsilon n=1 Tax=Calcidiscus leptoporus TaxID=127549 RepID=A0A7S0J5A0_9EUKA
MAEEELFSLRNAVHLGAYTQAISEANSINPSSEAVRHQRDFLMYRAFVEQGQYRLVIDEVGASAPLSSQAVKLLASYLEAGRETKEMVILQLKEWLSDSQSAGSWELALMAGTVLLHEKDFQEALKHTHQNTQIDVMALVLQIYLAMHRLDLARTQLKAMQEHDDDATLTKLAGAYVAMAEGCEKSQPDKYQDALYEFQELGEKYTMSVMLLNAMALCQMHMGRFDEAERLLQDALSKSNNDPNSMANLIVCMQQLRKTTEASRYTAQLKALAPSHPWVVKHVELESSFDRCANQRSK